MSPGIPLRMRLSQSAAGFINVELDLSGNIIRFVKLGGSFARRETRNSPVGGAREARRVLHSQL